MKAIELQTNGDIKILKIKNISEIHDKIPLYNEHYLGDNFILGPNYYLIYNDGGIEKSDYVNDAVKKLINESYIDDCYLVKRDSNKSIDDSIVNIPETDIHLLLEYLK